MTFGNHGRIFLGKHTKREEIFFSISGMRLQRKFHFATALRRHRRKFGFPLLHCSSLALHRPMEHVSFQSGEVMAISYSNPSGSKYHRFEVDVLQHFLYFPYMRMKRAVGSNEPVGTKIRIVYHTGKAHIAAERPDRTFILIFLQKSLIDPVPDKTSLQLIVFVNQVPIVLQIPYTVSHGMGVLAQNHRTRVTLVDMLAKRPDTGR